ncbi:cation diffusion facilitator family transporter [Nonomuraea sp. NPDC000554]|uniref:cation diffusion facilitator family transporter n=1 Tax=Nonomuraea sp. NPDC000554 TaxID=3154259 RepID=UPI0033243581
MRKSGGLEATFAALAANVAIAASKFAAFAFTGSSALLAEGLHSVADSGNQLLLLLGRHQAERAPTPEHPFGFGGERYFYAFLVSVVLFFGGGLFALYEGYEKLLHPHPLESWPWAIGVLAVAIVMESLSLRTAVRASNDVRGRRSWPAFIRQVKAPELPVVLLEDTAALIGLAFAGIGVTLTVLTGNAAFDGLGSIAIGALLVVVAVVLAVETKSMIIGEAASAGIQKTIQETLAGEPLIQRVVNLRTLHVGPEHVLVAAEVQLPAGTDLGVAAKAIAQVEDRVRERLPVASLIYLQPTTAELDDGD